MTGEKLKHNLSRFVVTVWVFAVLILTTSYTATLTAMMTVQQIRFNFNKNHVGHLFGSEVAMAAFHNPGNHVASMKGLSTSEEYAKFLLNKTVTFVVHELPYLKVLLGENPAKFFMVKTKCTTSGFGFVCIHPSFIFISFFTLHLLLYLLIIKPCFRCFKRVTSWRLKCPEKSRS